MPFSTACCVDPQALEERRERPELLRMVVVAGNQDAGDEKNNAHTEPTRHAWRCNRALLCCAGHCHGERAAQIRHRDVPEDTLRGR